MFPLNLSVPHVVFCSNPLTIFHLLRKSEIHELEMSFGVDQDVLGLQVAVCNALPLVQKLQYEDNFGSVELGCRLVETSGSSKVAEDLAAGAIIELRRSAKQCGPGTELTHKHVQRVVVLEAGDHCRYEGVACDGGKDIP